MKVLLTVVGCTGGFRQADSDLDSKVDSKWIFWTPKIHAESTRNGWLTLCFIGIYCGLGWILDSGWLPKKITLSLANLRA
jgi:hypothetical protein